ncbi:MAG: MFS transporter [Treponema sp.]|nr:MFS transporter [Treponema sp.]
MTTAAGSNSLAAKKSGNRYTVLILGSIMQLFLGILYVWSIFVEPVHNEFNWHVDSVKLTASFMLCFFVIGIIVGGKLVLKIGSQKVVLGGGLCLALGMLSTSLLPSNVPWIMYITYGIIGGFGVGSAYNAIIVAAQKWFPQKRGLATGIVVCSFGLSTVVFAPLINILIARFDVRNTFLILGGIFFAATIAFFRFIRLPDDIAASSSANTAVTALLAKKQYLISETIKTKQYYFIAVSLAFATAPFFILNPSFISYAAARGVPEFGTVIVMLTGVANACGRLAVPLLSDKIGRERAALIVILAISICAAVLTFARGGVFIAAVLATSFCFGGLPGLYAVLASDYFGIKNAGANYGAIMMGFAFSALVFPVLIGFIQSSSVKFITLSVMAAFGIVLIVLLLLSKKKFEEANA